MGNDKVVPPLHSGEEAVCMDHYGHLEGENTLTVSGIVLYSVCVSKGEEKRRKKKPTTTLLVVAFHRSWEHTFM